MRWFRRRGRRGEGLLHADGGDRRRQSLGGRELRPLVERKGRELREGGAYGQRDGTAGWTGEREPAVLGAGNSGCVLGHFRTVAGRFEQKQEEEEEDGEEEEEDVAAGRRWK